MNDPLIVGTYRSNIKCENFLDPETNRIRVRPLPGQNLPVYLVIECSRSIREAYPLGTVFLAKTVKICDKPNGRIYLRAEDQMIYKINQ